MSSLGLINLGFLAFWLQHFIGRTRMYWPIHQWKKNKKTKTSRQSCIWSCILTVFRQTLLGVPVSGPFQDGPQLVGRAVSSRSAGVHCHVQAVCPSSTLHCCLSLQQESPNDPSGVCAYVCVVCVCVHACVCARLRVLSSKQVDYSTYEQ